VCRRATRHLLSHCIFLLLLSLLPALPARAQDEFLINDDRVDRNQFAPRLARGATGTIVVAWQDGRNLNGNLIDYDTYAMTIRNDAGIGSTVNRRLNDDTPGAAQDLPAIAASPSGSFFCVWEDGRAGNRDIYGALLDTLGLRIGANQRLNDDTTHTDQANPAITTIGQNRYLVVWGDQRQGQGEIFAQYLTSAGVPIGPNFKVSVDPVAAGSYQGQPTVTARDDGTALVVWLDGREGGSVFGTTFDVYGQWLDPSGHPIGGNFKVNDTTNDQNDTAVAAAADSSLGFVVAWIDRRNAPADPGDVYAQRYDASFTPLGANIRVNDDPSGRDQRGVRAVATPGAAYLVWEDLRGGLGLDSTVESARVGYDALPAGVNFRVNAYVPGRQGTPDACWDGKDAIVAAWEDGRNGAPDIYAIAILPDGTRRGTENQLNDDASQADQRRPCLGRGAGEYVATWIDLRNGTNDLFGQWISSTGARTGPNHRIWHADPLSRPVTYTSAADGGGHALVVAQLTRDSDAGEIRGFLYGTIGATPFYSFWISDSLPSAQASPAVAVTSSGYAVAWIDSRDGSPRVYGQLVTNGGARVGANHAILASDPTDPVYGLDLDTDPLGGFWLTYAAGASLDQRLWIVHTNGGLVADRPAIEVASGTAGQRGSPKVGVGPDGRVELAWLGTGADNYSQVYHQGFDSTGVPLGPVYAVAPGPGAMGAPSLAVASDRSILTWETKDSQSWGTWLQSFTDGTVPATSVMRVDEDQTGSDQLDPTPALDISGGAVVLWSDARSFSNGLDILGRVFAFTSTAVLPPPPPPAPGPPPAAPRVLHVGPASPNPFAGFLQVPVEAPATAVPMRVRVLDVRGRVVTTLLDGPLPSSRFTLHWDGRDSRSRESASGVYWILVEWKGERRALRVVQLR